MENTGRGADSITRSQTPTEWVPPRAWIWSSFGRCSSIACLHLSEILCIFKEEFDDMLASFLETVSSIERLSSKDHLIELLPDIDIEAKDVADVLHLSDHEQSVEDLKQFILDAYNTAEKHKDSFIPFK